MQRLSSRWIDHWDPEDAGFWDRTGAEIANRNLRFSILSEHVGFSIWTMWSILVLFMGPDYGIDAAGKFVLVAVPTLVGSVLRLPYTFAVARFGGGNWTIISAALLLIPTILAVIVMLVRAHRAGQRLDLQDDPSDLPQPGEGRDRGRRRRGAGVAAGPRISGAVIGIAGAVGALGGLFINLAFRQSFLTAENGDPAYWSFLAYYLACTAITYVVYLRAAPAEAAHPRLAGAGV